MLPMNKIIAIFVALAVPGLCTALNTKEVTLTILQNNTELKELRAECDAENQRVRNSINEFEPTDFNFEYLQSSDDSKLNVGVSQKINWPSAFSAKRNLLNAQKTAFGFLYAVKESELRMQINETLEEISYLTQRISLMEQVMSNLTQLRSHVSEGYKGGELTILDVKKLDLECYRTQCALASLQDDKIKAESTLFALNNGENIEYDNMFETPMLLPYSKYVEYAQDNNPYLASKQSMRDMLLAQAKTERTLPQFSLGYRYAYEDSKHYNGLTVGISIPLLWRNNSAKAYKYDAEALQYGENNLKSNTLCAMDAAYNIAIERLKQVKSLSENALFSDYPELVMLAYKGGEINVITYIQEMNYFIEARNEELESLHSLNVAMISLNKFNPM